MMVLVLAVLGLVLGSFVNALVWRLYEQDRLRRGPKRQGIETAEQLKALSITHGRSMCTECHHVLSAKDLVPVFSWLSLRGRCRYCHAPIQDTPLVELSVACLFIVSYLWWPLGLTSSRGVLMFVFWLAFLVAFVALGLYDLRWFLLPDRIVFPLIGLAVIQVIIEAVIFGNPFDLLLHAGLGALIIAGSFFALFAVSKGKWIGFGDVKLAIVLGLLVGGPLDAILLVFLASLLGSFFAIPMLFKGKAGVGTKLPFGPFLLAATVIVMLSGDGIVRWYESLFYIH